MSKRTLLQPVLGALVILAGAAFTTADHLERLFSAYTKTELKYFEEVAFRGDRLYRWRQPIRVSIAGDQAKFASPQLAEIIEEIAPLLDGTAISNSEGGNFVIHYSPTLEEYTNNYAPGGRLPLGYAKPKFTSTEIVFVEIYLHPLLLPAKKIEVLKHEICHALGLLQHATTPYLEENLLGTPVRNTNQTIDHPSFSRLDRAAIRLLYDQRLRPNLSKKDFLRKTGL